LDGECLRKKELSLNNICWGAYNLKYLDDTTIKKLISNEYE
jgi:hypothetical protein